MSTRKTISEKIEAAKTEVEQKEARLKELLKQQKAQERKDRNHRLCERGGKVEGLLPSLAKLNDEQFEIFVQKTLLSGFAEKVLRQLLPPESVTSAESETDTAHSNGTAAKPAAAVQNVSANDSGGTSTSARVAS